MLIETFLSAFRSIRENRLRSSLTVLGVVIGVASVILLVSIGIGVKTDISQQIGNLGSNIVFILPGKLDRNGQPNPMSMLGISPLTNRDVLTLRKTPGVEACAPVTFVYGSVKHRDHSYRAFTIATTAAMAQIQRAGLSIGQFFNRSNEKDRVCVLGAEPWERIFPHQSPIGKIITVEGVPFRIIGCLKKQPGASQLFGNTFNDIIYLPYQATHAALPAGQINRIVVKISYHSNPDRTLNRIRSRLLQNHHGREDFGILTQHQLITSIYSVFNIVTALLTGISAISLVVAGIGIMNIMLVSVSERTKEIGIRMTVGARRSDIFRHFLLEAITLSLLGALTGVLLAEVICLIVAKVSPLHPLITMGTIGIAFGVCVAVGIVFGVAPAAQAARMNPIDAIRYE